MNLFWSDSPKLTGTGAAAFVLFSGAGVAHAQSAPLALSRASLANAATFTVTQTLAPKGVTNLVRVFKIEVKGNQARLDYDDQAIGPVRYLANKQGVFFLIPANKNAVKQTFQGGVEGALKVAFAQARQQLVGAKKIGAQSVSGQPTTVYRAQNGTLIYVGTRPGFRLPVKTETRNEGGTSTLLVSDIKLNPVLSDARFALPPGTKIIEGENAGVPTLPGLQ